LISGNKAFVDDCEAENPAEAILAAVSGGVLLVYLGNYILECGMVDRDARDRMSTVIRAYMEDRMMAFEFDEALSEINTDDATVNDARFALWFFYDDKKNHYIVASQRDWEYFNRLLLLLQSDGEISAMKKRWRWTARQSIAVAGLLLFGVIALWVHVNDLFFSVYLIAGALAMLLAIWKTLATLRQRQEEQTMLPFPSFSSLLTTRRRVSSFIRSRYPTALAKRRIRGPILDAVLPSWLIWLVTTPLWLLFAPIALLIQAIPERIVETQFEISV
jgi:hypothetical protein